MREKIGILFATQGEWAPTSVNRQRGIAKWVVVDASGRTLGRLSTHVAKILMGKHRPTYTPHADTGDFVVVINAEKVRLTGQRRKRSFYRWHTGYPGGLKEIAADGAEGEAHPVVEWSVKGMLRRGASGGGSG